MSNHDDSLAELTPDEAAKYVMDNDISELLADAEVVRERRPAKIVTALRIDLDVQAELEAAAAARGVGTSTLMRHIIEEWVRTNRAAEPADQIGELVRHLDAARQAANSLATGRPDRPVPPTAPADPIEDRRSGARPPHARP